MMIPLMTAASLHAMDEKDTAAHVNKFIEAAKTGNVDGMQELLTPGLVNINAQNKSGDTALGHAILAEQIDSVNFLLSQRHINPNIPNNLGVTALMMAAGRPSGTIFIPQLIKAGATIDAIDPRTGRTALHWAILKKMPDNVTLLVSLHANTHVKNKIADNALLFAIKEGSAATLKPLLHPGHFTDTELVQAFTLAYQLDKDEMIRALANFTAARAKQKAAE